MLQALLDMAFILGAITLGAIFLLTIILVVCLIIMMVRTTREELAELDNEKMEDKKE